MKIKILYVNLGKHELLSLGAFVLGIGCGLLPFSSSIIPAIFSSVGIVSGLIIWFAGLFEPEGVKK